MRANVTRGERIALIEKQRARVRRRLLEKAAVTSKAIGAQLAHSDAAEVTSRSRHRGDAK